MVSSLSDSFTEFIASANRLESSYRELQNEVARLRRELEERNRDLERSMAEAEGVRFALKRILDVLPCGVLLFDSRLGRAELANPEAKRLLGMQESCCGVRELPPEIQNVLLQAGDSRDSAGEFRHEVALGGSPGVRWIALKRAQQCADGITNPSSHAVLICSDITAEKQAEKDREHTRNLVALGEMSTVLAHEIRNPLTSLELITELLEEQSGQTEEAQQWISCLRAGVRQLCATTNNVLAFYTHGTLRFEEVELRNLVRECETLARPMARQAGVALRCEYGTEELFACASAEALKQALLNILVNGMKHTSSGGEIRIAVRRRGSEESKAIIEISDTGCGIPEHVLPLVFDAGFSGSGATPGLGLSVCRRILRQHEGEIRISNGAEQGAVVIMELPIR